MGTTDDVDDSGIGAGRNEHEAASVSLFDLNAIRPVTEPKPFPPRTIHTASIETIDNDYSPLLHGVDGYT